jgi:tetratricopeptide (TPR) repeat protein
VGIVALALFVVTLAPTVTAEDSGELIAAAWRFGVPHPPGYPLWTLLCGMFMHVLPFGEIAWRANLFSAVCSAGAAVVAYAAIRQLGVSMFVAAAASLVWVWSKWSWSQSVITEVYGLNSLLTAGVLLCVLRWYRTRGHKPLVVTSLLLGLGMAHHHAIALVGLAVLVWVLVLQPALVKRWRLVLVCIAAFLVGLLPYAYLPIRAGADPVMNWGDPSTLQRAWAHATRQVYGTLGPTPASEPRSIERIGSQLKYMGEAIVDDLTPWLVCAAALGLIVLARRNRRVLFLLILWLVCTGPLFVLLANFDLDRSNRWLMRVFFIPMPLALAISFAFLLEWLREGVYAKLSRVRWIAAIIVAVLVLAGPVVQATSHWKRCDYSHYWYAYDHAENLLNCMMRDAMVFLYFDYNTFPLVYLLMVEGQRPDVLMATYSGRVRPELYAERPPDSRQSVVTWLIMHAGRPAYCTVERPSPVPPATFVTAGLLYYLKPVQVTFDGRGLLDKCDYRNLRQQTVQDIGADLIMSHYHVFKGLDELERGDREQGLEDLRAAAVFGWGFKEILNKVGVFLFRNGAVDEGMGYCQQAARLDPRYTEPRWHLFQMYQSQARWADVRRQLAEIIQADPKDARACAEMGFLLHRRFNDTQGAVDYWRAALQQDPKLTRVRDALEQIESRPGG